MLSDFSKYRAFARTGVGSHRQVLAWSKLRSSLCVLRSVPHQAAHRILLALRRESRGSSRSLFVYSNFIALWLFVGVSWLTVGVSWLTVGSLFGSS